MTIQYRHSPNCIKLTVYISPANRLYLYKDLAHRDFWQPTKVTHLSSDETMLNPKKNENKEMKYSHSPPDSVQTSDSSWCLLMSTFSVTQCLFETPVRGPSQALSCSHDRSELLILGGHAQATGGWWEGHAGDGRNTRLRLWRPLSMGKRKGW